MRVGKSVSFGDICKSRYWLSIERKPFAWWRWGVFFGPTYNGTDAGFIAMTPVAVVIWHRRVLDEN